MEKEAGKGKRLDRKAGPVSREPFDKAGASGEAGTFETAGSPHARAHRLNCSATHGEAAYDNGSPLILRSSCIDDSC
jgi:hypothetical protein